MPEELNISDAEWFVMEAVWDLGTSSAAAIIRHLEGATSWNHRTIRTLLSRLVEKGFVRRIKADGGSQYRATKQRHTCIRREGRSFLDRVFRGDAHSLMMHFAREARLGPEKLEELRRILESEQPE